MNKQKQPTPEMKKFAAEAIRVSALNRAGLSTDADMSRLERMGREAQATQTEANRR